MGHSNRSLADFLDLLRAESIATLVDVRRFAGSRRHPHFGGEALAATLQRVRIAYHHVESLGGRRTERAEASSNTAWRVESFNAYADYMLSREFSAALELLEALAQQNRTAIMCSEALPWQCHRRLIADVLTAHGWRVLDIVGPRQVKEHQLPEFARVVEGNVTYPGGTLF